MDTDHMDRMFLQWRDLGSKERSMISGSNVVQFASELGDARFRIE
jgi:hypothetical protein